MIGARSLQEKQPSRPAGRLSRHCKIIRRDKAVPRPGSRQPQPIGFKKSGASIVGMEASRDRKHIQRIRVYQSHIIARDLKPALNEGQAQSRFSGMRTAREQGGGILNSDSRRVHRDQSLLGSDDALAQSRFQVPQSPWQRRAGVALVAEPPGISIVPFRFNYSFGYRKLVLGRKKIRIEAGDQPLNLL